MYISLSALKMVENGFLWRMWDRTRCFLSTHGLPHIIFSFSFSNNNNIENNKYNTNKKQEFLYSVDDVYRRWVETVDRVIWGRFTRLKLSAQLCLAFRKIHPSMYMRSILYINVIPYSSRKCFLWAIIMEVRSGSQMLYYIYTCWLK